MTPEAFEQALSALGWKGSDFCARVGVVPNTVWRWRKGAVAMPPWVDEYLRAMLALQRLHAEFVAVRRGPAAAQASGPEEAPAGAPGELFEP